MLPWAEMWRAAHRAGLSSQEFWSLSLREWRWLSGSSPAGLGREELTQLLEVYPDG